MSKTPGQIAYEAYRGTPAVPASHSWEMLDNNIKRAWHNVAKALAPLPIDGMTKDERDVWKAAYGAAMAAALVARDDDDGLDLMTARDVATSVADESVAALNGLGGLPIEVSDD